MGLTTRLGALALLLALLAAPAAAQPNPAAFRGDLAASGPAEADPGTVHDVTLTLRLTGDGFACASDAAVPVNLTVDHGGAAEGVILEAPDNATVPVAAGAYARPAHPYAGEAAVTARLLVARYAEQGASSALRVTATARPAHAEGCTTAGAAEARAEAEYVVAVTALDPDAPGFHPAHEAHGGAAFDAYLRPGESFSHAFDQPGRYPYHDHLQPELKGLVRVLRYAEGDGNGTEATVRITPDGYAPEDLAVKVGTTVTWVNTDNVTRTVSADEQHGQPPGLEPEDREALRRTRAADADGSETEAAAETPGAGAIALAAALAVAATLRRRR